MDVNLRTLRKKSKQVSLSTSRALDSSFGAKKNLEETEEAAERPASKRKRADKENRNGKGKGPEVCHLLFPFFPC